MTDKGIAEAAKRDFDRHHHRKNIQAIAYLCQVIDHLEMHGAIENRIRINVLARERDELLAKELTEQTNAR